MNMIVIAALVGVGIILWLKLRSPKVSKQGKQPAAKQAAGAQQVPYRSTVIICAEDACEAARTLAEQPFLDSAKETPLLPLPGCTVGKCRCRYEHRDDRRVEEGDRRLTSSLQSDLYSHGKNDERREVKRGRRDEDF